MMTRSEATKIGPWRFDPFMDGKHRWFELEHVEAGICGDVDKTDFPNMVSRIQKIAQIHLIAARAVAKRMLEYEGPWITT